MTIHDVTLAIHAGMPAFPGDPPCWIHALSAPEPGRPETYGLSLFLLGSHTGTHVDAPRHFVPGGADITAVPLEALCGPARVVPVDPSVDTIDEALLAGLDLRGVERLLFRTTRGAPGEPPFRADPCALSLDGARFLRRAGVRLVGIDALSIERSDGAGYPVHHALLDGDAPVVVVEGLDLRGVSPGDYELTCLPLPVSGADGAPARVVLVDPPGIA